MEKSFVIVASVVPVGLTVAGVTVRNARAVQADPEWVKTRTEMPVNVQVDNVFMSATDYGPMK